MFDTRQQMTRFADAQRKIAVLKQEQKRDVLQHDLTASPDIQALDRDLHKQRKADRDQEIKAQQALSKKAADLLMIAEVAGEVISFGTGTTDRDNRLSQLANSLGLEPEAINPASIVRAYRRIGAEPTSAQVEQYKQANAVKLEEQATTKPRVWSDVELAAMDVDSLANGERGAAVALELAIPRIG